MAVDRAYFAGDVEARDGSLHRIEHALLDIVLGAALGIVDDRPGFHDIEGRILDRHHRPGRPLVILILPLFAELIPAFDCRFEKFRIHIDLCCDVLERIAFFDPSFVDLGEIVFAPTGVVALVIDDRNSDRPDLSAFLIEDQMAGDARIILYVGVVKFQRSSAGVLRRRRVLIHEALAEFVHRDPDHFTVFVSWSGPDVADGKR